MGQDGAGVVDDAAIMRWADLDDRTKESFGSFHGELMAELGRRAASLRSRFGDAWGGEPTIAFTGGGAVRVEAAGRVVELTRDEADGIIRGGAVPMGTAMDAVEGGRR